MTCEQSGIMEWAAPVHMENLIVPNHMVSFCGGGNACIFMMKKNNICIHEEKKYNFCSLCPLRPRGEGRGGGVIKP